MLDCCFHFLLKKKTKQINKIKTKQKQTDKQKCKQKNKTNENVCHPYRLWTVCKRRSNKNYRPSKYETDIDLPWETNLN